MREAADILGFSEAFNKVSQDVLFYTLCIYGVGNKLLRQVKNWDLILEASNYENNPFSYVSSCGKVNRKTQVRKACRNKEMSKSIPLFFLHSKQ